jgi:hypothetical protein
MELMLLTGSDQMDAELAFKDAARARWRDSLLRRLRRRPAVGRLAVYDERRLPRAATKPWFGVREIPLTEINATVEPNRAAQFDCAFRPAKATRARWQRVWMAAHRGAVLPPISVIRVGEAYAVRDGHHRVSVARARGALTIDACLDAR